MLSRYLQKYNLKMKKPSAIGCRSSLYSSTTHLHPSDLHIHAVGVDRIFSATTPNFSKRFSPSVHQNPNSQVHKEEKHSTHVCDQ